MLTKALYFQGDDCEDPEKAEIRESAVLQPDMSSYLDKFPRCRDLMVQIRSTPNNDNKTPAGVLNEYATKLNLEVDWCDEQVYAHPSGKRSIAWNRSIFITVTKGHCLTCG